MKIAQQRADLRGLKSIKWINADLREVDRLNIGKFDFIECSGALTYLPNPLEGLNILKKSLKKNGGISLRLNSKHARAGVYQMQTLMRLVNKFAENMEEKILNTRKIMKILPATNWYGFLLKMSLFTIFCYEGTNGVS